MNEIDTGLKSTISYTPTVADVSGFILAGYAVDALNFAVSQLINGSWLLNISNQTVDYTDNNYSILPYYWALSSNTVNTRYASALEAAMDFNEGGTYGTVFVEARMVSETQVDAYLMYTHTHSNAGTPFKNATYYRYKNPDYNINDHQKKIGVDQVSLQILIDASASNKPSQEALTQITINKFVNDDFAVELDANATPFFRVSN